MAAELNLVNFDALLPVLTNIFFVLMIATMFCTMGVLVLCFMYVARFRIKATVFEVVGSGNGDQLAVGKKKYQRFRWNRKKTAWVPLFPLFGKQDIEPFSTENVYANNNIIALRMPDQTYIPVKIQLSDKVGKKNEKGEPLALKEMISEMNPVPHYLRKWNEIEIQQDEIEFQSQNFWEQNKAIIVTIVVAFLCLLLVGITIYLTYRYTGNKFDQILQQGQSFVDALKSTQNIPSR